MISQKYILFLLVAMSCHLTQAQSDDLFLMGTGGGFSQNGSLFLTYSIGEPCITYTQSDGYWITEGFQQPGKINVTAVKIPSGSKYTFSIFPNPVASTLRIESTDPSPWQLVQIVNALGQPLLATPIVAEKNLQVDLTHLIPGLYLLNIQDHTTAPITKSFIKI